MSTLSTAAALGGLPTAIAAETGPVELINALNATFGQHPRARASHAKGFCAQARFEPSQEARKLTRAGIFAQASMPAVVRLSVGGGNPNVSDKSRSVRGMAIRLQSAGETYDLVLVSEPVFFAATPESFVHFLQARIPDPTTKKPDPEKIKAYEARFPDGKAQPALLASHPAPASYASTPYYSNNAFRFVDGQGHGTWARIVVEPTAGAAYLDSDAEAKLPDQFLEKELAERLAVGPASFTVYAQPAGPDDSLTDSTKAWSQNGPAKVALGRLNILSLTPAGECDRLMFLPTQLPAGIEPSDDPILQARAAAYAVSLARRLK